ncbi:MAG TPA: HlyD family efflux transporter periplasmic adaptor subunit [Chloroflexi bacterium]|nr:HlyD family efflux transporter periplasmic adaptor subunit [Chloroflexota bacterium]
MEVVTMKPMKRLVLSGVIVLSVVLAGCGGAPEETPTLEAEMDFTPVISVSGEIVPAVWATVSTQQGGMVVEVAVEPGSMVAEGDLLVRLDTTDADLAVRQAEAALEAAQAQLALLKAGPRAEDISVAEAQVAAAKAAVDQAQAQRDQAAGGVTEADIAAAEAEVVSAELARKAAEDRYDQIKGAIHGWMEEEAILQLRAAEEALEAAQARLARLKAGPYHEVRVAQTGIAAAEAQYAIAQAQLRQLQAGATKEEIAVAQAAVTQAEAALEAARVARQRCEIRAPWAGTVGAVHVRLGESIAPGQPVVTMGDLNTLRVETTDLDEIDVPKVSIGQRVTVTFDGIPDRTFRGRVTRISPMAAPGGGGVSYTAIIELDDLDSRLRWGMTAFVDIETGE